jgi:steroid delta-isomerase-like uncharacterized protein
MTTNNARLIRRFMEAMADARLGEAAELMTADFVSHDPTEPDLEPGRDAYLRLAREHLAAITETRIVVHDQMSEGDRVASRWTLTGRHTGDLLDVPATGVAVAFDGIDLHRLVDGRIAEEWTSWDAAGLMQQIGVDLVAS